MATGLETKLVGQVGEFLVCAELGRRGLIATPFAGNVPGYDVVATDEHLTTVPVQVKTSNGSSWQFSLGKLLEIRIDEDTGRQEILGLVPLADPELIYVFVWLGHRSGKSDRFFMLTHFEFQALVREHHQAFLDQHGGVRPKKPESLHCAITRGQLEAFENRWELVSQQLAARRRAMT